MGNKDKVQELMAGGCIRLERFKERKNPLIKNQLRLVQLVESFR